MSRILIIPDYHYGRYPNNTQIEKGLLDVIEQAKNICIEQGIKSVFFLGDLFRKKDLHKMDLLLMIELNSLLYYFKHSINGNLYSISGNHDQLSDNFLIQEGQNSAQTAISLINLEKIDNFSICIDSTVFIGAPFYREGEHFIKSVKFSLDKENRFLKSLKKVETVYKTAVNSKYVLLCHQTPKGSGFESSDMVDFSLPIFRKFTKIYCGHIHKPAEFLNVIQTGSCLAYDHSEDTQKYFYVFDTETLENTPILIDFRVDYSNEIESISKDLKVGQKIEAKSHLFDLKQEISNYSKGFKNSDEVESFGIKIYEKFIKPN